MRRLTYHAVHVLGAKPPPGRWCWGRERRRAKPRRRYTSPSGAQSRLGARGTGAAPMIRCSKARACAAGGAAGLAPDGASPALTGRPGRDIGGLSGPATDGWEPSGSGARGGPDYLEEQRERLGDYGAWQAPSYRVGSGLVEREVRARDQSAAEATRGCNPTRRRTT